MKSIKASIQQSIIIMSGKAIMKRCQQAINHIYFNNIDSSYIIEVSKLVYNIRLQFQTEEEVNIIYDLYKMKEDI